MKGPNTYSPGDSCEVWYRNEWRPCRVLESFGWLGHQRVHIYDIGFYSWVSEDNLRHQTDPIADTILRERDLLRNECDRMVENLSLLSNELVKDGAGRIARKIDRIIGVDAEPSIVLRKNITRETLLDSLHRIADGLDIKVVSIAFNYAESDSVELVVQSKSGRFHSTIVKITDNGTSLMSDVDTSLYWSFREWMEKVPSTDNV